MPIRPRSRYNTEEFEILINRAKRETELADHLLYITFPLVKDMKFLMAIMEHIIKADRLALEALLDHAKYYKIIDPYEKKFANELRIYKTYVEAHHSLDPKFLRLLKKMYEIQDYGVNAVLKFTRGDSYILTTDDYKTKALNIETIKRYSGVSKDFITEVEKIIKKKPEIRGDI